MTALIIVLAIAGYLAVGAYVGGRVAAMNHDDADIAGVLTVPFWPLVAAIDLLIIAAGFGLAPIFRLGGRHYRQADEHKRLPKARSRER